MDAPVSCILRIDPNMAPREAKKDKADLVGCVETPPETEKLHQLSPLEIIS